MLYLFLGYLSTQLYSFVEVLGGTTFMWSIYLFSTVIFLLFCFFPVLGFYLAKLLGAKGTSNKYLLLTYGVTAGLIEKVLFKFNLIAFGQSDYSELVVFIVLFLAAFISLKRFAFGHK